jgi:hypothetical protein
MNETIFSKTPKWAWQARFEAVFEFLEIKFKN